MRPDVFCVNPSASMALALACMDNCSLASTGQLSRASGRATGRNAATSRAIRYLQGLFIGLLQPFRHARVGYAAGRWIRHALHARGVYCAPGRQIRLECPQRAPRALIALHATPGIRYNSAVPPLGNKSAHVSIPLSGCFWLTLRRPHGGRQRWGRGGLNPGLCRAKPRFAAALFWSFTMPQVTMRQMLEAGVHFGHQTLYWNPCMAPYIFGARGKIHIINLEKTMP